MINKLLLTCLIMCHCQFNSALELCESSQHFMLCTAETDLPSSQALLTKAEDFLSILESDFNSTLNKKIVINVYPNITAFHQAINTQGSPDWLVAKSNKNGFDIISPANPGPYHTSDSINQIFLLNIAKSFISQKYSKQSLPIWIVFGVASNRANYTPRKMPKVLPTFEQLENAKTVQFGEIGGFSCANSFTNYIETNYGWDTLLQLLADYNSFDKIVGMPKAKLYQDWVTSIISRNEKQ